MLPERFWKRCKKTICKLLRALRGERCSTLRCCLSKGVFSFRREYPLLNPQRKAGGVPPRPPTLLALCLKDCTRCAVQVRCTWLRHEPLQVVTGINRALLRGAQVTVVRRRTAVGAAALLRLPLGNTGGNEKRPRQRSFSSLISPCSASMSLICLSKTYSI